VTDAEALKILQEFAYAKPVRLQQAVSHVEARMLTLAQLAEMLAEPEAAANADTTSDATLLVSPGSRFDAEAG
jgi:hypothetical protein